MEDDEPHNHTCLIFVVHSSLPSHPINRMLLRHNLYLSLLTFNLSPPVVTFQDMETPQAMRWRSILAIALVMMLGVLVDSQEQCGPGANGQSCGGGNCCSQYGYCGKDKAHCGDGCQKSYGGCGSCFPATATVIPANGVQKPISQLSIGDKVAVWSNEKGEVEYEDVYAHGHLDAHVLSEFIVFTLTSTTNTNATKTLEMSPDHFAVTTTAKNNRDRFKRAKDVRVGDEMLATHGESHHLSSYIVSDIKREVLRGLYNPYTLRGSIIVNDVLASCHSDWFLDSTFDRLHISPSLLPSAYQTILAPVRMLYKTIGRANYQNLYHSLDSRFDIAKSAGDFGGYFKLMILALSPTSSRGGSREL